MTRPRIPALPLLLLLLALLACSGLSMKEAGYRNNLKEYDALVEKAKPPIKATVETRRTAYTDAYGKLPTAESEREKALEALNKSADKELKELEAQVEASNQVAAAAEKKAMEAYQAKFVGTWEGDGMRLRIDDKGRVEYKRKSGAVNKSLDGASVKEFRRDAFDVSLLGVTTTFKIDKEPSEDKGVWTTTVDGALLTKVAGPSGEPPVGIFTCRVLVNEVCIDRTDHFPNDAPMIQMSYRSTDVPKVNTTYKVQWLAEGASAGGQVVATANSELEISSGEQIDHVNLWSNIKLPKQGWPAGKYRVEVSTAGKVLSTAKFVVDAAAKP